MGGFCSVREECARHDPRPGALPVERLCARGATALFLFRRHETQDRRRFAADPVRHSAFGGF
jgi:hypothetical protein